MPGSGRKCLVRWGLYGACARRLQPWRTESFKISPDPTPRRRPRPRSRGDLPQQPGQYTSAAFADLASDYAVTLSHGRTGQCLLTGQCWDNALSRIVFASLKGELTDTRPWPTSAAAHRTLGYRSPAEFEEDNKIKKIA
jgi:transposase InsO family protein